MRLGRVLSVGGGEGVNRRLNVFFETGDRSKDGVGLGVEEEKELLP